MTKRIIHIILVLSFGLSFGLLAQSPTSQPSTQPTSRPTTQSTTQPPSQPSHKGAKMSFEQKFLDLGQVKKGEVRKFEFPFTNIGDTPLKIDLVSSCDCTTTKYPTREVAPGDSGTIFVSFDSTEKEESETIDIDIFLTNEDPNTGAPMIEMLQYKFELMQ